METCEKCKQKALLHQATLGAIKFPCVKAFLCSKCYSAWKLILITDTQWIEDYEEAIGHVGKRVVARDIFREALKFMGWEGEEK